MFNIVVVLLFWYYCSIVLVSPPIRTLPLIILVPSSRTHNLIQFLLFLLATWGKYCSLWGTTKLPLLSSTLTMSLDSLGSQWRKPSLAYHVVLVDLSANRFIRPVSVGLLLLPPQNFPCHGQNDHGEANFTKFKKNATRQQSILLLRLVVPGVGRASESLRAPDNWTIWSNQLSIVTN
jgi:hypothetical protein